MNVRLIALNLLDSYELEGRYVNLLLSSHVTDGLSREERALLTALLYTTVEHKLTYDYLITSFIGGAVGRIKPHTMNIMRLGMCQILHMTGIPPYAAVDETVKLGRNSGERGLINAVLRAALRARDADKLPYPKREKNLPRYLSVYYSFPRWIVRKFISLFGEEEAEELLRTLNTHSYTDITVNLSRISREELIERLKERGIDAAPSPMSSLSVRLGGSVDPRRLYGFEEGYFFVQDSSCAASVEVLGVKEGERVVDVCACPGGKSFAAAILTGNTGEVLSLDLHESKLPLVTGGACRLGFEHLRAEKCDATAPRVELFGSFDRVICDVPCSGLGVLSKKPDLRYREEEGLSELPELQYKILSASARYVREGGAIVYSTCTLNPDENEGVVRRFLAENPDFHAVDFTVGTRTSLDGMLTLTPHRDCTDGFFISRLEKNG